jgi:hypothetical protein
MADYTVTTDFLAKDTLDAGDPLKVIKGSYFDVEFDAIAVAIATKTDGDFATKAQAEAGTSDSTVMSPLRTEQWSAVWAAENGGIIADLHGLSAPGADQLLAYDFGTTSAKGFTLGAGLSFVGDTVNVADAIAGNGLAIASSIMSVGVSTGLTVTANGINLTDVTKGADQPLSLLSGVWNFDITALAAAVSNALAATDSVLVDTGGVNAKIAIQACGMRVSVANTDDLSLTASDMNAIHEFVETQTITLPKETTTSLPIGVPVVICCRHATQVATITAAASVSLVSIFDPAGATASVVLKAGGTALLYKTGTDIWQASGDIEDA